MRNGRYTRDLINAADGVGPWTAMDETALFLGGKDGGIIRLALGDHRDGGTFTRHKPESH